jgi:lysophospholipase L1-like esterase
MRRGLWVTFALAVIAGALAACVSALSVGASRPLRPASGLSGKPVNPAPGSHLRLVRPNGRALRVLFVGDSLTVGFYASRASTAFAGRVSAALRTHGRVTETIKAKSGVTASYWASRPLPAADLVVLELGTNDFSAHLTPRAAFDSNYRRLVANVRARSPHAQLLCLSLWRSSHYGYEGETLLTYNKIIARDCEGGAFVWISALYDAKGARQPAGLPSFLGRSDGFHPTDIGHRGIAAAIEQTLTLR